MLYRSRDKILKLMREQAECDEPFPDELHDISSLNGKYCYFVVYLIKRN